MDLKQTNLKSIFISELTKEFKHVLTFHSLQTNIQLHTSDKGKNKIIFEITSDGRKGRVVILCFGEESLCVITNQRCAHQLYKIGRAHV